MEYKLNYFTPTSRIQAAVEANGLQGRLHTLFVHAIRLLDLHCHDCDDLKQSCYDENLATLKDAIVAVQDAARDGEYRANLMRCDTAASCLGYEDFWAGNEEVYSLLYGG